MKRQAGRERRKRTSAVVLLFIGLALVAAGLIRRNRVSAHPVSASPREESTNWLRPSFLSSWDPGRGAKYFANISGSMHSKSGKPFTDAVACAFCAECNSTQNGSDPVCALADGSGRYVVERLPPGDYQVSLSASGHQPRIANPGGPVRLRSADVVIQDVELEEGGARVSGTVSDATGGPVIGAKVQASVQSDELPLGRVAAQVTTSGAGGKYTLYVPPGHVLLVARATGYADARVGTQAPADRIRLVLTPSSRISGTVVTRADGTPVSGLRVVANGDQGIEQGTTSDGTGAFTVTGLPPGSYNLRASGDGWTGRHSGSVTVDIADAAEKVVIQVDKAVRVTGEIRVGEGPCRSSAAYLTPFGQSPMQFTALGDLSGQVAFDAVPPGRYQSRAFCTGYGMKEGPEVAVSTQNVTGLSWKFDRGTDVTVLATTSSGKPVPGAAVSLRPASEGIPSEPSAVKARSAQVGADGSYRFLGVRSGSYLLGGPYVETPTRVELRDTTAAAEFTVTLKPVGAIEVVVKDAQGNTNDSVMVMVSTKAGPLGAGGIGQPLGDGRYHVGPLAADDYSVEIRDGVDPVANANGPGGTVHVREGEVTEVEMTYGGHSGQITGRVLDSAGMPVENVWVSAEPSGSGNTDIAKMMFPLTHLTERRCLTDSEGHFLIAGLLETAVFSVVASHALGGQARLDNVSTGEDVEIQMNAPGRVGGVVLDASGLPATQFHIYVTNQESAQNLVSEFGPDSHGRWLVDHVAPGNIRIQAQSVDATATVARQLAPSEKVDDMELRLQPTPVAKN